MYQISVEKAKKNKLFYVVSTATVYRPRDSRCLILKRSEKEIAHPGLWSLPGGKLEWENFQASKPDRINYDIPNWVNLVEKLVRRETKEECGLEIGNLAYLGDVVFIRPDKVPVVCLKFGSMMTGGKIKLAPEFDDYAWVNGQEIEKYKIIKGIDEEISKTIKSFKKKKSIL